MVPIPPPIIEVRMVLDELDAAFQRYAEIRRQRGRGSDSLARKMMRYWISYALAKDGSGIPMGDAAKIERDLMQLLPGRKKQRGAAAKSGRKFTKRQAALMAKYQGTVAAYLVQKLNWMNANTARRKDGSPAFWGKVGQFIGARKWSRNLHRAGFFPVLKKLRQVETPGYLPKPKNMPGQYNEVFTGTVSTLLAHNMAASAQRPGRPAPAGVGGIAPDVLQTKQRQLMKSVEGWLAEDERAAAARAGFHVSRI